MTEHERAEPHETVDAEAYAAHLERLDRIGREALAAEPAEAIALVREANDLVTELLPMHRRLMDELAHHRETLQAACDELAGESGDPAAAEQQEGTAGTAGTAPTAPADQRLDRLDALSDDDGDDVPF